MGFAEAERPLEQRRRLIEETEIPVPAAQGVQKLRLHHRLIGQLSFHALHTSIEAGVADRWRETLDEGLLDEATRALMRRLDVAERPGLSP